MRRIKAKLRSRRGASITFALLLFLVCAVISGVVIVAATTAAGHMSGRDDMDQRYYAVAAATELLRGRLEGGTVTVKLVGDTPTVEPSDADALLKSVSAQLIQPDAESGLAFPVSVSDEESAVSCAIDSPTIENGLLKFRISASGGKSTRSGTYTIDLIFASNVQQTGKPGVTEVSWKFNGIQKVTAADIAAEAEGD